MTGTRVSEYGLDAPSRDCARVTGKPEVTFSRLQTDSDDVVQKSASGP